MKKTVYVRPESDMDGMEPLEMNVDFSEEIEPTRVPSQREDSDTSPTTSELKQHESRNV